MKAIRLKIAPLLFLRLPPLPPALAGLNQESSHCHSPWSVFFLEGTCTSPGVSALTLLSTNNAHKALLARLSRKSEAWADGADLRLQSKCLYPVVTGRQEMDWSHVSHVLLCHLHRHLVSVYRWMEEGHGGHWACSDVSEFRRRRWRDCTGLERGRTKGSVVSWRVASLWVGGTRQFTLGRQQREMKGVGGRLYFPSRKGGRLPQCHKKHFLLYTSKTTTRLNMIENNELRKSS